MTKALSQLAIGAALLFVGCGNSKTPEEGAGTGGQAGSGGEGAGGSAGEGGAGEGGAGGSSGSDAGPCDTCKTDDYVCWSEVCSPDQGACVKRPEACAGEGPPVCGCDGQVYANECEAQRAGVDIGSNGLCDVPEGLFRCGKLLFCTLRKEYCLSWDPYDLVEAVGEECPLLPDSCGDDPTCDCVSCPSDSAGCKEPKEDEITLTCY